MQEAIAGVEQAVDEFIAEREAADEDVPVPLTERQYKRQVRRQDVAALHARLAVEAAEQNVSMNHWVVQKLADRLPTGLFDL